MDLYEAVDIALIELTDEDNNRGFDMYKSDNEIIIRPWFYLDNRNRGKFYSLYLKIRGDEIEGYNLIASKLAEKIQWIKEEIKNYEAQTDW